MTDKKVIDFYDDFVTYQKKIGINERVYQLFRRVKKLGLHTRSTFLELGCGIGTFTLLLKSAVKKGAIEAVDISPRSIELAQQKIKSKNIRFFVGNLLSYYPVIKQIDFISLFDVLEHIPVSEHSALFRHLGAISSNHTKILINIPNPSYLEFEKENRPETLQVIDQPLPLALIVKNSEEAGLKIDFFETYSIWVENDYQFFVLSKAKPFVENKLSKQRTILQRFIKRLQREYVRLRYRS